MSKWPQLRSVAMAALVGAVAGGVLGLYLRFQTRPVGRASGLAGGPGLVTIGCPAGGGGWITLYRGTEEAPCALARVPWKEYDDQVGAARAVPLHLADGPRQQVVVALDAMPGETGGWLVVLDGPENSCRPLAWRHVVLGGAEGPETLWVAGGDIDGDGRDEIVVGSPQAKGEVLVLDDLAHGLAPVKMLHVPWSQYNDECGETRPAVGDLDGDGKAEIVVGLGRWRDRGGWVAVYDDLHFAKWVRFPDAAYCADGGGTWPAVAIDEEGRAQILLGTDGGLRPRIAALSDPMGLAQEGSIDLPSAAVVESAELRPLCAWLGTEGGTHVLASLPDRGEASEAMLFDDASRGHAFLGWRRGTAPSSPPGPSGAVARDPSAAGREAALEALRARCGALEVSRGEDGSVDCVLGELSDPSDRPPVECANAFLRENAGIWGIEDPSSDVSLDERHSSLKPDRHHTTHVCFQQTVSGVPLLDHRLAVHLDAQGAVTSVTGVIDPLAVGETLDPTPTVGREAALDLVRQQAPSAQVGGSGPRLVAWRDDGPVRLCWEMEASSIEGRFAREFLVDAHAGGIVRVRDITAYDEVVSQASGRSVTTLGNTVNLVISRRQVDSGPSGGVAQANPPVTWEWVDRRHAASVATSLGDHAISQTYVFPAPGDFDRDGAWLGNWPKDDPRHREAAAAHRNMGKVLSYCYDFMQRRSWDGSDGAVFLSLRPDDDGLKDRCVWLGQGQIAIGRASGRTEAVLDVLAHEFAHGVISNEVGTISGGAPGAVAEHIADALGEFTEYRELSESDDQGQEGAQPSAQRPGLWVFGEEKGGGETRDFRACDGHDFYNYDYDDTPRSDAQGAPVNDNGNVHRNAAILDHWLYVWVHGEAQHQWGGYAYTAQGDPGQLLSGSVQSGTVGLMGGKVYAEDAAVGCAEKAYCRLLTVYGAGLRSFDGFRVRMLAAVGDVTSKGSPAVTAAANAFKAIHLWPPYRDPQRRIVNVAAGSTLPAGPVTFRWAAVRGATAYFLTVGSTLGGQDLGSMNLGARLSATLSGLPRNGGVVYVRLWYKLDGSWHYVDQTYGTTDAGGAAAAGTPRITGPAPGSTLDSSTVTFSWSAGSGVSEYRLMIGSDPAQGDLFDLDVGTQLSARVEGLPTDGRTVCATLWYRKGSAWHAASVTYTAAGGGTGATPAITSPVPGSTLNSSAVTFLWTKGTAVAEYRLQIGSAPGGNDLLDLDAGTSRRAAVTMLPTDGSTVYVRLSWLIGGAWQSRDETYTAVGAGEVPAALTSPAPGAFLTSTSQTFSWSAGSHVTKYFLLVGSAPDVSDAQPLGAGTSLSTKVTGLPSDGRTLYARLHYLRKGYWCVTPIETCIATGGGVPPAVTDPVPGATLSGTSVTFSWSAGNRVGDYVIDVGSTPGGNDFVHVDAGKALSATVTGLPFDGSPVYLRLSYEYVYESSFRSCDDAGYTGWTGPPPALTSPAPGSTLTSTSAQFTWAAGMGTSGYTLDIGSAAGGQDIFHADAGNNLSVNVTGLPTDGRTLYVTLGYQRRGQQTVTATLTALTYTPPVLTGPAPSSTLATSATFTWTAGAGITAYGLKVGSAPGANDFLDYQGADLSATVTGLPKDGLPVYVRLLDQSALGWHSSDAMFKAAPDDGGAFSPAPPVTEPTITGPIPGEIFSPCAFVMFKWCTAPGATQFRLQIGSKSGGKDLLDKDESGNTWLYESFVPPTDGRTLYVRLMWNVGDSQRVYDAEYIAPGGTGLITSPVSGSVLAPSSATFTWSARPEATRYRLQVGTQPMEADLFDQDMGTSLSADVAGLPTDGRPVYARLLSLCGGTWLYDLKMYTAANTGAAWSRAPLISSPVPGSTLPWGHASFTWRRGSSETGYRLRVASADGSTEYFNQDLGIRTSANVSGLPTDGSKLKVSLSYLSGEAWNSVGASYSTASDDSRKPGTDLPVLPSPLVCVRETDATIVGSVGGRVHATDGATVSFPAGSLSSDTTVSLIRWSPDEPTGESLLAYDVDLGNATLTAPATIILPIDDPNARVRGPQDVHLYQEDKATGQWLPLSIALSDDLHFIKARVNHFSRTRGDTRSRADEEIGLIRFWDGKGW